MTGLRVDEAVLSSASSALRSAGLSVVESACVAAPDFGAGIVLDAFSRADLVCSAATRGLSAELVDLAEKVELASASFDAADRDLAAGAG
jgi:hypothetical protein